MIKFSLFLGGATSVRPEKDIDFFELCRLFKEDEEIKNIIEQLRIETDKHKKIELKNKLPYVTIAGRFTYRNNASLIPESYSWTCPIDIDIDIEKGINSDIDVDKLYNKIIYDDYVCFAAKSPRGNGIKALIQLKKDSYNYAEQYTVFRDVIYPYFEARWKCEIDIAQGKLSQPFYISHDANLHVKKTKILLIDTSMVTADTILSGNVSTPIKDLKPFVQSILNQETNKWEYFNRISMLVGGLFAGGILKAKQESILNSLLDAANNNKFVENYEVAKKQIIAGFNYGLKFPISKDDIKIKQNINKIINKLKYQAIENNEYIRVGNDFFRKISKVNMRKSEEIYLSHWKRQTIIDDFGLEFINTIPKFTTFCNVPDYINYQETYANNYNLFHDFIYIPKKGEWSTIEKLLKHIFGDQYKMGLDYFQLLFLKPTQILPVLALVSKENQTGKTTFVDFLALFFKGNTAIISTKDFEGNFNQHYITKHIIAIDESELGKEKNTSRIKQMATQKAEFRKGKFQDEYEIDFFGKLIILSNNENSFINIKDEDIRYWVRKVSKLKSSEFDKDFLKKCHLEIPAFADFLLNREMFYKKSTSRAYFNDKDFNTEWLELVKKENKTTLYHEIFEKVSDWFCQNENSNELYFTIVDLQKYFFSHNKDYSVKYISKVLRDEFKIESKMMRTFGHLINENRAGRYFLFKKADFVTQEEDSVTQNENTEVADNESETLPF